PKSEIVTVLPAENVAPTERIESLMSPSAMGETVVNHCVLPCDVTPTWVPAGYSIVPLGASCDATGWTYRALTCPLRFLVSVVVEVESVMAAPEHASDTYVTDCAWVRRTRATWLVAARLLRSQRESSSYTGC